MVYKTFGMRRTGTNYIRSLIISNVSGSVVLGNTYGWKHGRPLTVDEMITKAKKQRIAPPPKIIRPLVVIKNPYSWYLSIHRWYNKFGAPFVLKDQYEQFNLRYGEYLDLVETDDHSIFKNGVIFRYEDVIKRPKFQINRLGETRNEKFVIPKRVNHSNDFTKDNKAFYLGDDTFGLGKKLIGEIADLVDWDLMSKYGYKQL